VTALLTEHPRLGVECVLRKLRIPSATYYRWRRAVAEPCERRRRDVELTDRIKEIHADSGGIYEEQHQTVPHAENAVVFTGQLVLEGPLRRNGLLHDAQPSGTPPV
jgi:hypothetical protein